MSNLIRSFYFFNNCFLSEKPLSFLRFENNKLKESVYKAIRSVKYEENSIIKKIRKF